MIYNIIAGAALAAMFMGFLYAPEIIRAFFGG